MFWQTDIVEVQRCFSCSESEVCILIKMPHVHGSNARNLSVYLSLSQTSKNAMSFLLSLVFSSAKSKKEGWNGFCLEVGVGGRERCPNNVYTCE
jgi:hypothetical protein